MKLLALDTSTESCSVALQLGDRVLVRRHPGARQQTAVVLPLVQALLAEAGVTLSQLDAVACTHGPGAFTGVRVAVSVAQGLAFGAGLPVAGISTLATLALQAAWARTDTNAPLLPLLDARMGELYAGAYLPDADGLVSSLAPDRLCRPEDVAPGLPGAGPWTGIGSGWQAWPALADDGAIRLAGPLIVAEPDAEAVLALAARVVTQGGAVAPERLVPVYLRDTVAWKKLGEQGKP